MLVEGCAGQTSLSGAGVTIPEHVCFPCFWRASTAL